MIVLSVPHAGTRPFPAAPARRCPGSVVVTDAHTDTLARLVAQHLTLPCTVVVNPYTRHACDMNRPLPRALCDRTDAGVRLWTSYHDALREAVTDEGPVFLFDMHGHAHRHGLIEVGFGHALPVPPPTHGWVGTVGDFLEREGLAALPSPRLPTRFVAGHTLPYFHGGYITRHYRDDRVRTVQLECPPHMRRSPKDYAPRLAKALEAYVEETLGFSP